MKTKMYLALTGSIALTLLAVSCKKNHVNPTTPPAVTGVQLSTNSTFGSVITDNNGRSLYLFSDDAANVSNCTGGCAVVWPAFYKENPSIGTGLAATDFGVITNADGNKQTTYKGWPLYYYSKDVAATDLNGDGVGKSWFVAKPDYTVMVSYAQLIGNDGNQYTSKGIAGTENSQYITDVNGRTLYMFTKDTFKTNKFSTGVAAHDANWPIDAVTAVQNVPSILNKADFDVITVFGQTQLVYKGHPLYYFGQDNSVKGSTKGVSFPTAGAAIWQINNTNTVALTQ
ncbi:MAG: putative lipoprotein with conserved Yx(FWY)xxD motif [Mucilaginibacter sp.]|nr:putative lipoprotein with conserved Yx(FWY)xxD motif [Mucilaginibacter sp.]